MLANVKLLRTAYHRGERFEKGQCVKVYIQDNGIATLLRNVRIQFIPRDYQVIIPEKEFDRLLNGTE